MAKRAVRSGAGRKNGRSARVTPPVQPKEDESILVLADGSRIDKTTGLPWVEPTFADDARSAEPDAVAGTATADDTTGAPIRTNRASVDLPGPVQQINCIALILVYELWGLVEHEMATVTGLEANEVSRLRSLDAYKTMYNEIVAGVDRREVDNVRHLFVRDAMAARRKLKKLVDSRDEKVALGAVKDMLDRGGHRPVDIVEERKHEDKSLTITIVRRDETTGSPKLIEGIAERVDGQF